MTNYLKSWLYTVGSVVMMGLSAYYHSLLQEDAGPESGYFAVHRMMFLLAVVLMGVGVYTYLSYTRKSRKHRADSLTLTLTGLGVLIVTLIIWIGYGGVQPPFDAEGYTAVNIQIVSLALIPLPFWVRGLVLGCSDEIEERGKRRTLKIASLVVALIMLTLIITGGMMGLLEYNGMTDIPWSTIEPNGLQ